MSPSYRDRVLAQADGVARLYLAGEELGQPATREQKEFIEGIVASDYDGRTVIELLQNGHDAHDSNRTDGALEFVLVEDEADHGVLYVANAGSPVREADFKSMCRIAMSNKRPDQGIGNKGVGFKSVLQLSDSPEVYSAAHEGVSRFDGFCFRFARSEDFDDVAARVAPERLGLADELRANVASLKVPVPLDAIPPQVEDFASRGFSTVIRLVLRSATARERAFVQLTELTSSDVPLHLFLERVATIAVKRKDSERIDETQLTRSANRRPGSPSVPIDEVTLQDQSRFLVLRRTIPEAVMTEVITRSRQEGGLSSGWDRWEGDAQVSVALRVGPTLLSGRLYTFLPMGVGAIAPLPAFVNAPFFARLDRRSLQETIPLNERLFIEVAALCAETVILAERGDLELPDELLIDLISWDAKALPRLRNALDERHAALATMRLLPALHGTSRVTLDTAWLWNSRGKVFTDEAVAAAMDVQFVDYHLDELRRERVCRLAEQLGRAMLPGKEEIADFSEACASGLTAGSAGPAEWADFYDDLADELGVGSNLIGRRVLIDEHAELLAVPSSADTGRVVFFAPLQVEEGGPALAAPTGVRERLAFMLPAIPWLNADRRRRKGRVWLEAQNLVREYRTDAVLDLVGESMRGARDHAARRECLRFAFDVWRGATRDVGAESLRQARLLLPTVTGWRHASEAYFGPGWGGPAAEADDLLARLVDRGASASQALANLGTATLRSPDEVLADADVEERKRFVEALGARHGLWPKQIPARHFRLGGHAVGQPLNAPNLPIPVPLERQAEWRALAAKWPRQLPSYSGVDYLPTTDVAVLPGQDDWSNFDDETRRLYAELILRGLNEWPGNVLQFHYGRPTDMVHVAWPTLVAFLLATADWLPQTTPGQRTTVTLQRPADAWWLRASETPDYLPAQPGRLRNLTTERVLQRLQQVGVRFWDDPSSGRDRLHALTALVGRHGMEARDQVALAVRKAYEAAWEDVCTLGQSVPHELVVGRRGRLSVIDLDKDSETVYVANEAGIAKERLLAQAPVLMLPIRDRGLADRILQRLQAEGCTGLRSTADADVSITADGMSPDKTLQRPLREVCGSWLSLLILAVMEFHYRGFPPVADSHLRAAARRLNEVAVVVAHSATTAVDGHPVDDTGAARSLLLRTDEDECILVAGIDDADPWLIAQAASMAIAELVEFPSITDSVRLAILDLERLCAGGTPSLARIARALGLPPTDIEGLASGRATWTTDLSAVVAVLACVDVGLAEELQGIQGQFAERAVLRDWLDDRLAASSMDGEGERILALAERGDLLEATRSLDVPLSLANSGLRALGLPPLHNPEGHARQLAAYIQHHRAQLHDQLRDRFRPAADRGEPLDEYVRLRDLPGLTSDEEWLDQYWDVPTPLLAMRTEVWLDTVCPARESTDGSPLLPVDELRDAGRRTVTRVVANARNLVEAWTRRHQAGEGHRPGETSDVIDAMTSEGRMDFHRLTPSDVVTWLWKNGQWPDKMHQTTSRAELELSEEEVRQARARLEQGREQRRRERTYVQFGTRTYSEEATDLLALVEAVREEIPADIFNTPVSPAGLAAVTLDVEGATRPRDSLGKVWRASSATTEKSKAIGLAGEVVVGEWLRHRFGVPPEDTWVSGYRLDVFADGQGDDRLGFDFRVITPERTWLIEAKSTTGEEHQLALGESEVRRAGALADHETYLIAFVTRVLEPAHRRVHVLPNPMAPGGLQYYQVAGRAMRLLFELA